MSAGFAVEWPADAQARSHLRSKLVEQYDADVQAEREWLDSAAAGTDQYLLAAGYVFGAIPVIAAAHMQSCAVPEPDCLVCGQLIVALAVTEAYYRLRAEHERAANGSPAARCPRCGQPGPLDPVLEVCQPCTSAPELRDGAP